VTGRDLVAEAIAELYSADPEEFTERRAALAAGARAAGEAPAAKRIGGLRKPTRSAWVVNQLARGEPGVAAQLVTLGDELRDAQASLDGARMRELSVRRRQLVDALAQQAFTLAGQHAPPAALRDEVTSTLGAALADPQVAEQLQAGTLLRAARPDGFGLAPASALTLVPPLPPTRVTSASKQAAGPAGKQAPAPAGKQAAGPPGTPAPAPAGKQAAGPARKQAPGPARSAAAAAAEAEAKAAAEAKAKEDRRRRSIAEAEQAVAEADQAFETAAAAEREQQDAVDLIEEQLTAARQRLEEARRRTRRARTGQHAARQALGRLHKYR
jgi:hypothetical protein